MDGDFTYNGMPTFIVNFSDFATFTESINQNNRVLSRNIMRDDLRDYFKKSRDNSFCVSYQGVILDMRNNKD